MELILDLVKSMRVGQWVKNLAVFAGVLFSGKMNQPAMVGKAILAFVSFSLAASAIYLINDIKDKEKDLKNPRTKKRPIASGKIPIVLALFFMSVLLLGSFSFSFFLGNFCLLILSGYIILNLAYTLKLKNTVIADVICIALGFVLRVLFGVYAVESLPSPWIVICIFFLALFLGFGKRRGEIWDNGDNAGFSRPVLLKYTIEYLNFAMGATATITIISYALFSLAPYHSSEMVITTLPVVYCILRYSHQVIVENRGQSPEKLLYKDKMIWIGVFTWVALCVGVIYLNLDLIQFANLEK